MIRFLRPFQFSMPQLVPVTAKIIVHSDEVVERETPDGTKYLDSMRKTVLQPMRIFWCLVFGSGATERVTAKYAGEILVEVKDGTCNVLSRSVNILDAENGAIAEVRIIV